MEGGADPDNRRGMDWKESSHRDIKALLFKDLIQLRKNKALKDGDIKIGYVNDLLYISRYSSGQEFTLYTNVTNKTIEFKNTAIIRNNADNARILPHGFIVIK
ncbi:MAG: hypothetical protein K5906_01400 [Bacilli bacterium]|nr:hypothetical protein [Bacilli bacterium]